MVVIVTPSAVLAEQSGQQHLEMRTGTHAL
jgi:hypothetical protein